MDFTLLESLLYGFISGLTEILPVSSKAHQALLVQIFNSDANVHLLDFMVHFGILMGVLLTCGKQLRRAYHDYRLSSSVRRRSRRRADIQSVLDFQLVKNAAIPMLLGFLLYIPASNLTKPLYWVSAFFLLSGIILHIPIYLSHGNKDSRSMSRLDAVLIGLGSVLSVLPGVSRLGMITSISIGRGAAPAQALRWGLFLTIPAMVALMCCDVYCMVSSSMPGIGFPEILQAILGAAAAFIGTICAISVMKLLSSKAGYLNFSYYCWGAALFTFILCLFI